MWVVTVGRKPSTLRELDDLDGGRRQYGDAEGSYLAAKTRKEAIDLYLHHFGFTWEERHIGLNGEEKVEVDVAEVIEVKHWRGE